MHLAENERLELPSGFPQRFSGPRPYQLGVILQLVVHRDGFEPSVSTLSEWQTEPVVMPMDNLLVPPSRNDRESQDFQSRA